MIKKYSNYFVLLCICFISYSVSLNGQRDDVYKLDWKKDGLLMGSGIAFTVLGDYMLSRADKADLDEIRLLDREGLPFWDKPATTKFSQRAETISDGILYTGAALPFFLYAFDECRGEELESFVMTMETFLITNGITNIVKASAQRYRPYNYNPDVPQEIKLGKTSKRSFFSGHASNTAAFCFMTARVLDDMHPHWSKKRKRTVWTVAALLPLGISYGRYEAGKHFPSDVLTGYAFGAAVGLVIPIIHRNENIQIEPGVGSLSLTIKI